MTTFEELLNRENILEKIADLQERVRELEQANLELDSLDQIAPDGGELGSTRYGDTILDEKGVHTSADLVDINWWLPLNLSTDDVTGIYALFYDGEEYLYVGGDFRRIGGIAATNIARYSLNSRNWYALGSGIGVVSVIAGNSSGDVYISDFEGGASKVYVLDGGTWVQVGSTLNSLVRGLAFDGDDVLHICGSFTNAGGDADADRVALLVGSNWESLDAGGVNGNVGTMVFDKDGTLYIGGDFTNAGGDTDADGIAKRVAGEWVHVGNGLGSPDFVAVGSIVFDSTNRIFICGRFTSAGGDSSIQYIAELIGDEWYQVGEGELSAPDYSIRLAVGPDDTLYAFGRFLNAGGDPTADHIARLENNQWRGLSNAGGATLDIGDYIACVQVLENGSLIAGGVYHFVGAIQCEGIAIYCKLLNEGIDLIAALFELYSAYVESNYRGNVQTYNPTVSNATNTDSTPTVTDVNYFYSGDMVWFFGTATVDPTATGLTTFQISPPIASNFTSASDAGGTCIRAPNATQQGAVRAVVDNKTLQILFVAAVTTSHVMSFSGSYRIR